MDVEFVSTETIKPFSSEDIQHRKPLKLSLFDQLFAPGNTFPIILFYQTTDAYPQSIADQLKRSLSETLSTYYFSTGRVKDGLYIDQYGEGVPFTETKVNVCLSDFLRNPQIEMINHFIPYEPFAYVSELETNPIIAVQLNVFECGGMALGVSFLHKAFDATSAGTFLKSWSVNHRSESGAKDLNPSQLEVRLRFPPIESPSLTHLLPKMNKIWSSEKMLRVKRFVFDAKAIASLRQKARSERVDNPSRIETISSFLWKFMSAAAMKVSDSPRPSLSVYAVNIRQRATPPLAKDYVGNAVLYTVGAYNLADTDQMELQDLVALSREAISNVTADSINNYQGDKLPQAASKYVNDLQGVLSLEPEMFFFSSWVRFGFNDLDFGWGKPVWSSIMGGVSPAFTNATIFKETGPNDEDLEAWVALEENKMAILERDPEFLAFVTPDDPKILP